MRDVFGIFLDNLFRPVFNQINFLRGGSTSSLSHFLELYGAASVAPMWFSIVLSLLLIKFDQEHSRRWFKSTDSSKRSASSMVEFNQKLVENLSKKIIRLYIDLFFPFVKNINRLCFVILPYALKGKCIAYPKVCNSLINVIIWHVLGAFNIAYYKTNAYTSV